MEERKKKDSPEPHYLLRRSSIIPSVIVTASDRYQLSPKTRDSEHERPNSNSSQNENIFLIESEKNETSGGRCRYSIHVHADKRFLGWGKEGILLKCLYQAVKRRGLTPGSQRLPPASPTDGVRPAAGRVFDEGVEGGRVYLTGSYKSGRTPGLSEAILAARKQEKRCHFHKLRRTRLGLSLSRIIEKQYSRYIYEMFYLPISQQRQPFFFFFDEIIRAGESTGLRGINTWVSVRRLL